MRNLYLTTALLLILQLVTVGGAQAAATGTSGNKTGITGKQCANASGYASKTGKQDAAKAKTVSSMPYVSSFVAPGNIALQQMGATVLPPTRLDSFVAESGYNDHIYGDEGTDGPPPYCCFEKWNRIDAGIYGDRDAGLTTNHGSVLPSAWGKDEFIGGPEWSMSGSTGLQGAMENPPQQMLAMQPKQQYPQYPQNNNVEENPWQDNSEPSEPSPPNPNDPNNMPAGYIGVYQHGHFLGSFDPNVDSMASYLQREHPASYKTFMQQTGGGF